MDILGQIAAAVVGGGGIAALFTWLGQKAQASSQVKAAEVEANTPAWSSFVAEVKEQNQEQKVWLEARVSEQSAQINAQDGRIVELKEDISRLKVMIKDVERKYEFALDALRRLLYHHPDTIVQIHADVKKDM